MHKLSLVTIILLFVSLVSSVAQKTYTNPVFRADFPDPSVQRGADGYFYAYATGPNCLKSKDLVNWQGSVVSSTAPHGTILLMLTPMAIRRPIIIAFGPAMSVLSRINM